MFRWHLVYPTIQPSLTCLVFPMPWQQQCRLSRRRKPDRTSVGRLSHGLGIMGKDDLMHNWVSESVGIAWPWKMKHNQAWSCFTWLWACCSFFTKCECEPMCGSTHLPCFLQQAGIIKEWIKSNVVSLRPQKMSAPDCSVCFLSSIQPIPMVQ